MGLGQPSNQNIPASGSGEESRPTSSVYCRAGEKQKRGATDQRNTESQGKGRMRGGGGAYRGKGLNTSSS